MVVTDGDVTPRETHGRRCLPPPAPFQTSALGGHKRPDLEPPGRA